MGEKNKKNNGDEQPTAGPAENNKKKDNGGGGGGGKNNGTVVLKADLHCEGCVSKVLKCIRSFDGVDTANIGGGHIITVVGKVDPAKLRERVEQKTHKRVELVSPSPPPKKDNNKENAKGKENNNNNGGDNGKQENNKKESSEKKPKNKSDEKKPKEKEPPVTTAVLKMHLHCEGCIQKIYKRVTKTKGYQDMKIDRQKELITVTGAMDMAALAGVLKKHLKKEVQILPPKKEVEKKENDKGKNNGGGGGEKGRNNGGDKGKNGGGDGGNTAAGGGGEVVEGNKMQFQVGYPYSYPFVYGSGGGVDQFHYNPYAFVHAPQIFSDENPNACSVM